MNLKKLLTDIELIKVYGNLNIDVKGIADDSRKVENRFLFVAIPGLTVDGHDYISKALEKGARVIVGEKDPDKSCLKSSVYVKVKDSREALSFITNNYFGNPSSKLKIIGVTGTDGKTTTSNIIYEILRASGKKVGLISTISAKSSDEEQDTGFHVTNPEPIQLFDFLGQMVSAGCDYCVLEVTSHGIDQHRIDPISFEAAVLTNIAHEHLDYHKTYDNYLRTKAKIFEKSKIAVLNKDDKSFTKIEKLLSSKTKILTYSIQSNSDFHAKNITYSPDGLSYDLLIRDEIQNLKLSLKGEFNVYNSLAAIAVSDLLGINTKSIKDSLSSVRSPRGRVQEVKNKKGIRIIIDYAHTPNGVESILKLFSGEKTARIISIVSAEGERDPKKRFDIPKVAAKYSDITILNPIDVRGETPESILEPMIKGALEGGALEFGDGDLTKNGKYFIATLDRGEAINKAINDLARRGDIVLILGKGHETGMDFGNYEAPWSDLDAVQMALKGKVMRIKR